MSRFPTPLDDFETDDFDFPTFEAPPRRQSRPTSRPGTASPRRGSSAPRSRMSNGRDDDSFDVVFDEEFNRPARPRPSSLSKPAKTGALARGKRPGTNSVEKAPVKPRAKTPARRATQPPAPKSPRVLRAVHFQIAGVLFMAFGGLLAWNAPRAVPDGALPRYLLFGLRYIFGIGAIVLPLIITWLGVLLFTKRQHVNLRSFWRGAGMAFLTLLTASHLYVPRGLEFSDQAILWDRGGYVGGLLATLLRRGLGEVGAVVALGAFGFVALLLWSESTVAEIGDRAIARWREITTDFRERWQNHQQESEERYQEKLADKEIRRAAKSREVIAEEPEEWEEEEDDEFTYEPPQRILPPLISREAKRDSKPRSSPFMSVEDVLSEKGETSRAAKAAFPDQVTPAVDPQSSIDAPHFIDPVEPVAAVEAIVETPVAEAPVEKSDAPRIEFLDSPPPVSVIDTDIDLRAVLAGENAEEFVSVSEALEMQAELSARDEDDDEEAPVKSDKPRRSFGEGPLMPTCFDDAVRALDAPLPPDNEGAEEEIQKGVLGVQETLAAFKIDAKVTDVKRGPVITRYEVQPSAGVRVASIANLDKDLARSLSALAVRIEAPVPGKNVVGIEIPNKKVNLVRMRDVLEQPDFLAHQSRLAFVLGKDIAGQPKWGDLTKMPHMLIAGSTNSGKSVCLNSIIASILVRAQPDEVRFSLIDPKRVELTLYRGIKHLMHDVVVEPKQAVIALRRAIEEMDRRYKLFASRGVNIVSFNSKLQEGEKPLPYIVIVIDELADLMMTAAAEFEKLICRLAQLARATGIHLIVATQRPSVNVITGVIKANIPARIAFAVASQVDSRTILDSVGAERLIGSGDMLYDANDGGKSVRIQGAFLSEEEVNRIVDVVKGAYTYEEDTPDDLPTFDLYAEDSDTDFEGDKPGSNDEKRDALYEDVKEFVARHQEMSASLVQRKFEIGYPRAGRIVDQLERDGIVGPADGPKPRRVIGGAGRAE